MTRFNSSIASMRRTRSTSQMDSGVQRNQLQAVRFQSTGHGPHFLLQRVFEMAARAENLNALKSGLGDLPEQFRRQFLGNEQIGRKESLHGFPGFHERPPRSLPLFWRSFRVL